MYQIRFIYVAISVAVSAFAAYGTYYLLLLNLLLLPVFLKRKDDLFTPIFAVTAAFLSFYYFSINAPEMIDEGEVNFTITWSDHMKIDGGSLKGFAKTTTGMTVYATYQFQTKEEKQHFIELNLPAMQFDVSGSFQVIEIPSHPYAFSMGRYLKMNGASGVFKVEEIKSARKKQTVYSRLAAQRKKVKLHIEKTFPESLVSEAKALLIGDRSEMSEEDAKNYRTLGITHLFAISGLHVGLLTFIVREFLLRLKVRRETVDLLIMLLLPLYAVIAGSAPSVWRAVIVTMLMLLTLYGRIPIRLDSVLALSVIGFLLYKPYALFQPGFQLSYMAALSLILSSPILARQSSKLMVSFLVTAISQLSLYPILLIHFYELSLSSFLVNLLYVPLYSVIILPVNILLLVITYIAYPLTALVFFLYVPFRELIHQLTVWFSAIPYQLWTPGKPALFGSILAVAGILRFYLLFEERVPIIRSLPFILIPALFIHLLPYTDGQLRVTYLDVGQGDSIVIELPYKRAVYVIDAGGTVTFGDKTWKTPTVPFEVGRNIVVPYLKGRGVTKVDKLIISHADLDHMGGADEVIEDIHVGEIHLSPSSGREDDMEAVNQAANKRKVPMLEKLNGDAWRKDDYYFYYVSPDHQEYVGNDSSLALYMKTTGPSFLFTGDMEEDAERKLLLNYRDVPFGELILKVGHHGSKTSSTEPFIEKLRPKLAVISAGRNNWFGHPHEQVLENFQKYEVPVLVTADQGSITVKVKGERYTVHSMR